MQIDYVELPAPDLKAMKAFYGAAFGWTFTDYGDNYVDFAGAGLSGGFDPHRAVVQAGGALVILYSDDLKSAESAISNAGGQITERHEFPGGSRFHFRDPCGNELAVWAKE